MGTFITQTDGRFAVHLLSTDKFRTRYLALKVARPLHRQHVTALAMLPYLWMQGTTTLPSAREVLRYADSLFGASVRTLIQRRGHQQVLEVQATAPEVGTFNGADAVLEELESLVIQLAVNPAHTGDAFPSDHVEREKTLHERRIQSVFDNKITYALERSWEAACAGQPVGLPRLGYREDLRALTAASLWSLQQEVLAESDVHFYVVGKLHDEPSVAAKILNRLRQAFGDHGRGAAGSPVHALAVRRGEVQQVVEKQRVQQGKLNLVFRTGVSYGDDEYVPLLLANGVLGGFPHSKLFMNVREKASLAYYASSMLDGLTGLAVVQTGIETANRDKAYDIIRAQVDALQAGQVTDDELEFTRRGLTNQYRQVLDQPASLAEIHFSATLAGVERDVERLIQQIGEVDKAAVVDAASRFSLDTVYFLTSDAEVTTGA
ncbi:EF-P 5-aminopentanol modification-associated protein YfmF [Alicyclobacillus contaminans]|uniref:EF-P 5-aminopentanol modification-associated protein YfmF n=1 Tax=Alicyclobacillus contaminans TaxID=392016 RepID=UPI0006880830|nr:pitrilysin family protein [Alicyclobacillus contaminans]